MDTRFVVAVTNALAQKDSGVRVNVTALCADLGITRKTFYKWATRYRQEGIEGLQERSRRPQRSPGSIAPVMEDAIVEYRKRLDDRGLDNGPASIRWELSKARQQRVPSEATIWRVLVRRGFVVPQPKKRPNSSLRRFEAPAPNEWWQIDACQWRLADATVVEIINIIDDHSRVCVESRAVSVATTRDAWAAFSAGCERLGLPRGCLSDNGMIFSGRIRGCEVYFEAQLRAAGVKPITSRPYHPQTCGKVERFQQTLKKWLRRHPAKSLTELQAVLEEFRHHYNHERPHRGIDRMTPWQRFSAMTPAAAPTAALPNPMFRRSYVVTADGSVSGSAWSIKLGAEHAGRPATVVTQGTHVMVFIDGSLVRDVELDTGRHYQPSGKPSSARRPHIRRETTVSAQGKVTVGSWIIACGAEHIGRPATVELTGDHVTVVIDGQTVRDFDLDTSRRYQGSGRPRGRPRRGGS